MQTAVVIGQGYVGLPLARGISRSGIRTIGFDLSERIVSGLASGRSHIDDVSDDEVKDMLDAGYRPTHDPTELRDSDVIVICVPTPLTASGEPDLSAVEGASRAIAENLRPGTLVVLESTTYPGTTEELVLPILEGSGLRIDRDFHLAYSPERIDPGNATYGLQNTPKVVGGVTAASTARARDFYSQFVDVVVTAVGAREAETAKLLENTYRHINIALVNEMAKFCHDLDIDIWDVIRVASTKPFGFQAFYPGPGVGGHCIPIDPNYLSFEVRRRLGYPFQFVELAESINRSMPGWVAGRTAKLLASHGVPVAGARVLVLGVTYKADISDQRESPAIDVAEELAALGARISFHDPRVEIWRLPSGDLHRVDDLESAVAMADAVVLLQAHSEYDVPALVAEAQLFVDTRGVTRGTKAHRL
jgi:nucleotide sugar dehydrogenase